MESSTTRRELEAARQADIKRKIALLQAQLIGPDSSDTPPSSPKRKRCSTGLLAPATPSPKKRKVAEPKHVPSRRNTAAPRATHPVVSTSKTKPAHPPASHDTRTVGAPLPKPAPSTVLQKLASAHSQPNPHPSEPTVVRSSAFSDKAAAPSVACRDENTRNADRVGAQARDERLALVEELALGPADYKPPFDDPHFEKLEPNSMIRLSSRSIPYEDIQDHLRGRYYLSPSKLYSVIRLLPNKQGYDVPVEGDWLTIAVVAERGKVKYSQAPVGTGRDETAKDDDEDDNLDLPALDAASRPQPQRREFMKRKPNEEAKPRGKKYVNLKLIDFGCRSRGSSTNGGQSTIKGDAFLSLLLFEADGYDTVTKEDGRTEKVYKGGSRGAFEKMATLREGAVVALLNPRILKPFQHSSDKPHPTDNILALTPESIASVAVIGYSQDLGMCKVVKRDGTVCGGWCDKRVAEVCDWHIQHAVERKRAGRAEFSAGTSGMSTGAKKKPSYDPARQWGLKPEPESNGSGATYVVSGHIISSAKDLYLAESMGRDAQAKASRKSAKDTDRALQQLLQKDKEGSRAVLTAREYGKQIALTVEKGKEKEAEGERVGKKRKTRHRDDANASSSDHDTGDENARQDAAKKQRKSAYSAQLIRNLGFDPTAKEGRRAADLDVQSKLDALTALQAKRDFHLGPRPGKKSTCVHRPEAPTGTKPLTPIQAAQAAKAKSTSVSEDDDLPLHLPDSSDDEMENSEIAAFGKPLTMLTQTRVVDLDSSDGELEVTPP